jgi:hypothetical protein
VLVYAILIDAKVVLIYAIFIDAIFIDAKEVTSYFFGIALTVSFRTAPRSLTS